MYWFSVNWNSIKILHSLEVMSCICFVLACIFGRRKSCQPPVGMGVRGTKIAHKMDQPWLTRIKMTQHSQHSQHALVCEDRNHMHLLCSRAFYLHSSTGCRDYGDSSIQHLCIISFASFIGFPRQLFGCVVLLCFASVLWQCFGLFVSAWIAKTPGLNLNEPPCPTKGISLVPWLKAPPFSKQRTFLPPKFDKLLCFNFWSKLLCTETPLVPC